MNEIEEQVRPPAPSTPPPARATTRGVVSTVVILAVVVAIIVGFNALAGRSGQSGQSSGASTRGGVTQTATDQGVLLGGAAAPSFTLIDQTGATVTLDSLKGKPTVFTFFDSLCPHTDCSLMAQYINFSAQDMGADAGKVNWVALSLNPWHDTPQSVDAFLSAQKMQPHLTYLLGSASQLQPLWDAFHMQSILQANGVVIHTTGVYLLDTNAHEQVYMDEGFDPRVLSADASLLLRDGPGAFSGKQGAQSAHGVTMTHSVSGMQVTLTATPGQYGSYNFIALVQNAGGAAVANATVTLDLTMPSMAMSPVHADLKPVQPASTGAYRADGVLSMNGAWSALVTITAPGSAPVTTTFAFAAAY